ncbi:MAG: DUF1786 domain-containing protein [Thermomicrobiales bacterium]|nr:DUF1786 domain-containing protein [Thermomicrobiales bacterium]
MLDTLVGDPLRILAIDVGAGTQDVLVYQSDQGVENCTKLVLPSMTRVVAWEIEAATIAGVPIYLDGNVMGGGASSSAIEAHLAAGLDVFANPNAARSLHNDLDRVRQLGVSVVNERPTGTCVINMRDVDLAAFQAALSPFGVEVPELIAVAVQDHGYLPGAGGREFRYEFLQAMLADGGDVLNMCFQRPPDYMLRMHAVASQIPGAFIMDTGAAAVLGVLGDPLVATAARDGAILVNIGNMHTFGVAVRGRRIFGLFEHHTGGINAETLRWLVDRLRTGRLTHGDVREQGGHGAAFHPDYQATGPFEFVAITGPNRHLAAELGYHQAAPFGDMMLTGPFGLVEGTLQRLHALGYALPVRSLSPSQVL